MALSVSFRLAGGQVAPCSHPSFLRRPSLKPRRVRLPLAAVRAELAGGSQARKGRPALVWFKNDLRVDDHPGLVAAVAQHEIVVPLYVFDRRILANLSDDMLQLLLLAVEDLKRLLISQGSDLIICFGTAEDVIFELVNKIKSTHIFTEEEVDYNLRAVAMAVASSMSASTFSWGRPEIIFWRTPFYDVENLKELPASYNDFLKLKLPVTTPLTMPTLSILSMELQGDGLPTLDDLKSYVSEKPRNLDARWNYLKSLSAKSLLAKDTNEAVMKTGATEDDNYYVKGKEAQKTKRKSSVFASPELSQVSGGTDVVLNALAAYLRYLEGTSRDDWQELHDKLCNAETRDGASFGVLFKSALQFGTISRRRVYYEAIKYEKERNAGFLSPFGYSSPTVAAAVDAVCSMEWYWMLALKSQIGNEGMYPVKIWRWRGYIIQYTALGYEGPPVLLVHGFGAFLEHFRDNISNLVDGGHRVWAITLLGFGKSEKPNIMYTERLWAELLRDFIIDVVGEPAHVVGNSIGGYIASLTAGLWPALVKSLILLNTAGSIVPNYSFTPQTNERRTSGFAYLQARLLLIYLRSSASGFLKNCYPTNTERGDKFLVDDMIRASYDPGVPIVLECITNFDLSVPLNYLFGSFSGNVLVVQGMKDPITNSEVFVSMLRQHCSDVKIRELDAGHCPHDELPEKVNSIIREWTSICEGAVYAVGRT